MVVKNKKSGSKSSATVKTTSVRPKRPKVDRGEEIEQLVRQMFKATVDLWCKENLDEQPSKDERGNVVDNLTATFTSSIETLIDAATDSYLSTVSEEGDDDDEDEDEDEDGEDGDEDGDEEDEEEADED